MQEVRSAEHLNLNQNRNRDAQIQYFERVIIQRSFATQNTIAVGRMGQSRSQQTILNNPYGLGGPISHNQGQNRQIFEQSSQNNQLNGQQSQFDDENSRQEVRVRSYLFSSFLNIRRLSLSTNFLRNVIWETLFVVFLSILNILIRIIQPPDEYSKNEQVYITITLTQLIFVFLGFIIFRAFSFSMASSSNQFYITLLSLIAFQLVMNVVFLVVTYSATVKARNIQLKQNGQFKSGGEWTINMDSDQTFIHLFSRIIFFFGSLVSIFSLTLITALLIYVITIKILQRQGNLGLITYLNQRNQALLRNLRKFPYGTILFKDAIECAICLDNFEQNSEIVQLKCSKLHIYHFLCIKNMLESDYVPDQEKKCPLCRKPIELQDPPILT